MHFSIPDTEEFSDENGSTYMGYNIHINGVFHCTVRYKQLHYLHEQLKKEYGVNILPVFPPKKLLPLSSSQLEERRALLEKYIQTLGQDPQIANAEVFNGFLLSAQQETSCEKRQEVPLDIFLMNGYKISLTVLTTERSDEVLEVMLWPLCNIHSVHFYSLFPALRLSKNDFIVDWCVKHFQDTGSVTRKNRDTGHYKVTGSNPEAINNVMTERSQSIPSCNTDSVKGKREKKYNKMDTQDYVLEKACHHLNLPSEYVYYFSLFLIKRESDGDITILRKLQDFESPYISQKSIQGVHRVVLRKSYWDPGYDLELMSNSVALNLLYVQTVSDVERCWVLCSKDTQEQLASLQARGAKREYLELARTLKYYGFLQFRPCLCDYPRPGSRVLVSAGNRELNLRVRLAEGQDVREGSFKVTRMRCWRITTLHNNAETSTAGSSSSNSQPQLELSFEYLMSKDKLQWITISSEQAILMSVCLQAMVDELLLKKNGTKRKQPGDRKRKGSWSYMKRDGSSQLISVSQSNSADGISSRTNSTTNGEVKSSSKADFSAASSMRRLSEKLSSVSLKSSIRSPSQPSVENEAFEGIGDEDL